ncbi:unnamed protein product [Paramecium primaurelia]|uniref:Uncharacterized protein n=1 Tax=Paramecium primaurelia TaxID=5886 RepID=A0A8S1LAY7_PARPR|nr:unnamed protein product [Paramecium primaurelia]
MQQNKLLQTIQHIYNLKNPLFREKIIMLCLVYVSENKSEFPVKVLLEQLPFQFDELLYDYIKNLNSEDPFTLSKAFDLLTHKSMQNILDRNTYIKYEIQLLKYIAQQYKVQQNYHVAIKTMKYVLELEYKLEPRDSISIVSSQMSLVTILSNSGQHTQALNELNSIQNFINQIHDQKPFLKLICIMYYNYGVEWEHLGQLFQSQINLSQALEIAKTNKFDELLRIIEQAIENIKKSK